MSAVSLCPQLQFWLSQGLCWHAGCSDTKPPGGTSYDACHIMCWVLRSLVCGVTIAL